jgi:putative transposase
MSKQLIDRQEQGRIIAQMNGSVNRINDKSYIVNSQSGNGSYNVNANELGWNCSCKERFVNKLKSQRLNILAFKVKAGESLRNVQKFLRLQGVNINHNTVYRWIKKYVGLMGKYLEQIKPNVGDAWRTDELFVKVKGDMKYLYALMDDETRFWIAQQVADTKYTANINPLFKQGKELTGKRPNTLISDGARNFNDSFNKEFYTNTTPRTRHISHIRLQGDHNNNKMERLNGEFRDREKIMRGLKRKDTPILAGYQIFHNYVRPHEGLNNITPAEACGIKIEGQNKWITRIQNASKNFNK